MYACIKGTKNVPIVNVEKPVECEIDAQRNAARQWTRAVGRDKYITLGCFVGGAQAGGHLGGGYASIVDAAQTVSIERVDERRERDEIERESALNGAQFHRGSICGETNLVEFAERTQ